MITAYHRPKTLEEALNLLSQPGTVPLGGGTLLSHASTSSFDKLNPKGNIEAVDLQLLGLDTLTKNGNELHIGATLTLQSLLESDLCPAPLKRALKLEAPINIRNMATVAGTLVACDGRSPFVTTLLAMDARVEQKIFDNSKIESRTSNIGDFLPLRPRGLITSITIPLNIKLGFEYVSRTPSDTPIVCVVVAGWSSGRMRMAVGGYGKSPMLAMDGTEISSPAGREMSVGQGEGLVTAARNAFHEATDDFGSAEYRMDVAGTLAKRCVESFA